MMLYHQKQPTNNNSNGAVSTAEEESFRQITVTIISQ